ncbi:ABC transporter substrate-binding protein [Allofournierella sp.]|uniref:ABC transporter substrate-binding protein n=1 Tax=Allofournierella sp. TaxID=1940256 RepID=UPI003AB6A944
MKIWHKNFKPASLLLAFGLAASLLLGGCGAPAAAPSPSGSGAAPAQGEEPVTIKYVTWRLEDKEVWEALAQQFHKENPNITIEFIYSKDNSSHYMTVESNLLVGEGMDLFDSHPFADKFLKYASEGMLVDLSDTAGAERMTEGARQLVTYQGKPYGFSYAYNMIGLVYNKDLFQQYSVKVPETYEELKTAVASFRAAGLNGVSYCGKEVRTDWLFKGLLLETAGMQGYNAFMESIDSGALTNIKDNAAAYEVIQQMSDMYHNQVLFDYSEAIGFAESLTLLAQGRAPMVCMGTWCFGTADKDMPGINYGFVPIPAASKPGVVYGEPAQITCIPKSSKNIEAAKTWLNFLSDHCADYTNAVKFCPSVTGVEATFEGADTLAPYIESGSVEMMGIPQISKTDIWNNAWVDTLSNILFNGADVDQELAAFEAFLLKADLKNK